MPETAPLKQDISFKPYAWLIVLIVVVLVGFDLRRISGTQTTWSEPIRADAADYFAYARNLKYEGVYSRDHGNPADSDSLPAPDAVRTPGYPLLLLPFVGHEPDMAFLSDIVWTQIFISTLTLILLYVLARAMVPPPWAVGAVVLTALSPHLVVMSGYVLTETLFCGLLTAALLAMAWANTPRPKPYLWLVAGLLLGATDLTRPTLLYFTPIAIAYAFLASPRPTRVRCASLITVGFAAVYLPWVVRNFVSLGSASDPQLLINFLHHGMYPGFEYDGNPDSYGIPYRFDPRSGEIGQGVLSWASVLWARFQDHPWLYLQWYLFGKPVYLWQWGIVAGMGDIFVYPVHYSPYQALPHFQLTHWLMYYLHWPFVIAAAGASLWVWLPGSRHHLTPAARNLLRLLALVLAYVTGIHMIGAPFSRYSIPFLPIVFLMATVSAYSAVKRFQISAAPVTQTA